MNSEQMVERCKLRYRQAIDMSRHHDALGWYSSTPSGRAIAYGEMLRFLGVPEEELTQIHEEAADDSQAVL